MVARSVTINLENLRKTIEGDLKKELGSDIKIWFWPRGDKVKDCECDKVKGFYGDGKINNSIVIWIAERPSLPRNKRKEDKFPDWMDKIFYELLQKNGLENIHLTDFVKIMGSAGKKPTEKELGVSVKMMKKEIKALKRGGKKLIIIANTRRVESWIKNNLPEYKDYCRYFPFFKNIIRYCGKEKLNRKLKELYQKTL